MIPGRGKNKSIFEQGSAYKDENDAGLSYARIISVSADKRNCEIITWGSGLSDKYFREAQIVAMDTERDGGEAISIPRKNSLAIVAIMGSQAFILGFIRSNSVDGAPIWGNEIQLRQGDKLFTTKALNRLSVRSSGLVEAVAAPGALQTIWSPKDKSINEVCRDKITLASGGKHEWRYDLNTTLCREKKLYKKDGAQSSVIIEERGHTAGFSPAKIADLVLYSQRMGTLPPGLPDIPVTQFFREIDIFGLRTTYIGPTTLGVTTGFSKIEDGLLAHLQYSIGAAKQVSLKADGLLGDVNLDLLKLIKIDMTPSSGGGFALKTPLMNIAIEPSGAYTITNGMGSLPGAEVSAIAVSPLGAFSIRNKIAEVSIKETGDISLKNKTVSAEFTATGDTKISNVAKGYDIAATAAGEVSVTTLTKAGIKMGQGKVALGGPAAELLDILDQFIDEVTLIVTGLSTETHMGNMGLPTLAVPAMKKPYVDGIAKITNIKILLASIKGSL